MSIPKWLQKLSNATIKATIAGDPAVATASGWTIKDGVAEQTATEDPGVKQLQDNIAVLGGAATGITAAPLVGAAISNPYIMRAVDLVGSIDGARNLVSNNGVSKTIDFLDQGRYGRAALSGAGDLLDIVGIGDTTRMVYKLGDKAYRGYHAFNTISPYSYDNLLTRGKDYIKSLLLEKKYTTPAWKGSEIERQFMDDVGNILGDEPKRFSELAREDAWAIYTGQTPKNGMYVKNADGTFSYSPEKLKEFYQDSESFGNLLRIARDTKYDALGVTHGGLWKAESTKLGTVGEGLNKHTLGNLRIEDMWDLQPFQREGYGLIGGHLKRALSDKVNSPILTRTIESVTNNKLTRAVDKRIKDFEFGPIVGGNPFYMATDIPYTAHLDISSGIKAFDPKNFITKIEFGRIIPEGYLDPLRTNKFNTYAKDFQFDKSFIKDLATSKKQGGIISAQSKSKLLNKWQQLYDSKFGHIVRNVMNGKDSDLSDEEYVAKYGYNKPVGGIGIVGILASPEWEGLEFPEITAQHFGKLATPTGYSAVESNRFTTVPQKATKAKSVAKTATKKPKFSKAMKAAFKEKTGFDIESAPKIMQERELAEWQKYVDSLRKRHKRNK